MSGQFARLIGIAILPSYLAVTILIGWVSKRRHSRANDFLNASRSLPLWVVVAAFLSANCGALEIVGLSAVAAQYGAQAFHFYWVGAIPGMIFLAGVMIPLYMRSGVQSLPEYLEKRFDARVRLLNSWLVLATGTALGGIGLYAMAQVLYVVFGWPFTGSVVLAATVVLIYASLGGLRATIYNEVFQLLVIVLGLAPLLYRMATVSHSDSSRSGTHWHLWSGLPMMSPHASMDQYGVIIGLGFVLSCSYWCTDFVLIQRALTAKTIGSGQLVPLLAGFGKLGFSILVVVPALGAAAILGRRMPVSFDQVLPALMVASYGPALLGLGMTALLASLMSGLAANVSAFSAVWTEEIYRKSIRRGASEEHYIRMGRISIFVAIALSIATSYLAFFFHDLMEYVQLLFSLFGAPFFAIFLMGTFTRRATSQGAIAGLVSGVTVAIVHHGMVAAGWLVYGSLMSANFYVATFAFGTALVVGLICSKGAQTARSDQFIAKLRQGNRPTRRSLTWWILAAFLLTTCAFLNYLWR